MVHDNLFLEAFHLGLCNSNIQSLKPRINQHSDVAEHVTLPTRSKVRTRKVKNVLPKYTGMAEKAFDHYFKPWIWIQMIILLICTKMNVVGALI